MMLMEVATIAIECIRNPGRRAVWSPQLKKYVCPDTDEGKSVPTDNKSTQYPPLSPEFTLVFATAAGGTFLFIVLCVVLTLASGRNPGLMEEVIRGLFSLAQIGFGAVVGLLGGRRLQSSRRDQEALSHSS